MAYLAIPALLWALALLAALPTQTLAFPSEGYLSSPRARLPLLTECLLPLKAAKDYQHDNDDDVVSTDRRQSMAVLGMMVLSAGGWPLSAFAKDRACTDVDSCRELGDAKIQEELKNNPIVTLDDGVRYKVLRPGTSDDQAVKEGSRIDLIYSIQRPGRGRYMYSQGFGFEEINVMGQTQSDLGIDSLNVVVGRKDVPVGVEQALIGMKRGERRRVTVPPSVGFETSNWKPMPKTPRAKQAIVAYQQIVNGNGSAQPPFPLELIWDVEVLRIRN